MSFQASTVQITVNVFDKDFLPLVADDITIDGTLVPLYTVNNVQTATIQQRVQDTVTVTVGITLHTGYTQAFETHYGADGNLEPIVINVIMFPIVGLAAAVTSFITNFCIPPVTRIKGTHPDGNQYKLYATMNEPTAYTVDWEYPVLTPIGTGQTVEAQFGALGLKNVQVYIDDGTAQCDATYSFILQNLNINTCYGQDIIAITDISDNEYCQSVACFEPFDMGIGSPICCDISPGDYTVKFKFRNLDDNAITISPPGCLLDTEVITGGTVFNFFTVSSFNVAAGGEYEVIIQVQTGPCPASCGLQLGTVWLSMIADESVGVCCNRTFDISADIQDKTIVASNTTVNLVSAVDDCATQTTTITNNGCANVFLPTLFSGVGGGCLEQNIPITADYDQVQLAALPTLLGNPYLAPGASIDIIFEYCPEQVEEGCCDMLDVIGECNTLTIEVCYLSVVPPSCIDFLIHPCDSIKLSVPGSGDTINDEPALTCAIPNLELRISGNAFFPPCETVGCEGDDCELTIQWSNITTGSSLPVQTYDPDTFSYSDTPIWNYLLTFPDAGLWEATVTATWCDETIVCKKQFTVCHEITVTRVKCHLRRLTVNTTTDQDITVFVESLNDPDFTATFEFNTSQTTFIDIALPGDDAYRITITFEADGTEKIIYIDEICALAECYREMVLKIMCNDTDPCCKNCDPKKVEEMKRLRYMVTQIMALFLSLTAFIHKDTMSYIGIWEDDECRVSSQEEIAKLIKALKAAILRCGVCNETVQSQITSSGCQNC